MPLIEILILIIGLNAALLVIHDRYDDGFFGRLALGGMVFMALITTIGWVWLDYQYEGHDPVILTLLISFAIFLARHTQRWWRHARKKCLTDRSMRQ